MEVHDLNRDRAAPGYALFSSYVQFEQRHRAWILRETLRIDNLAGREYIGSVIIGDGNAAITNPARRTWYAG